MIPVLLIAKSFVRQNRWLLMALAAWPFVIGAFLWSPHGKASSTDVADLLQQEVFYGVAVITFLASSAIYNDRRSRRIIGVLSKGVSRTQYLLGLLVGGVCCAAAYFAAVVGSVLWLVGYSHTALTALLALFLYGCLACMWMAALALLFSTFAYPFFAAAIAVGVAAIPFAVARAKSIIVPSALIHDALSFAPAVNWTMMLIALLESAAILGLGSIIFAHRDVTVSVE